MAAEEIAAADPALHPAVPDLRRLLAILRRPPFRLRIGVDREVRCTVLLERLAARGVVLADPADAADWLAPLLSVTEADQRAVREVLREEVARRSANREADARSRPKPISAADETSVPGLRSDRSAGMAAAGFALVLAVLAGLTVLAGGGGEAGGNAAPVPVAMSGVPELLPLAVGLLAAGVAWLLLLWARRPGAAAAPLPQSGLRQRLVAGEAARLDLLAPGPLRSVLRALREHILPYGLWEDMPASIRATVRAGGVPEIVFGGRPRLPDYLLLAEHRGPDDQAAMLGRLLLRRLEIAQVHVDAYAFAADPALLRPWTGRVGAGAGTLAATAARAAGRRLLVVSDGRPLVDELTDGLAEHLAPLRHFTPRVLLTPVPQPDWGATERLLAREGFIILPLGPDGLAQLADWLTAPEEHPPPALPEPDRGPPRDLAAELDSDPSMLRGTAPTGPERRRLVAALRRFLGPTGFLLLAGAAVSPLPGSGLTVRLGLRFGAAGFAIDETTLGRLTRLPWLRRAPMPSWLRAALLAQLAPAQRLAALDTVLLLLAGAGEQPLTLGDAERGRLARLVRHHPETLVREDPILAGLLDQLGVQPNDTRRKLASGAAAVVLGAVAVFGADRILAAATAVSILAANAPVIGTICVALSLIYLLASLVLTARLHAGRPGSYAGVDPMVVSVISAILSLAFGLCGGGALPGAWQGALVTAGLATVPIALSPALARLGAASPQGAQAWLSAWPAPWGVIHGVALGGCAVLAWLAFATPADGLASWLSAELPIAAAVLIVTLAAASGMAPGVPAATTVAWGLLAMGGQALAGTAAWSVLRLVGFEQLQAEGLGLVLWLAADLRLLGGGGLVILLSGGPARRALVPLLGYAVALGLIGPGLGWLSRSAGSLSVEYPIWPLSGVIGPNVPVWALMLLALPLLPLRVLGVAAFMGIERDRLRSAALAAGAAKLVGLGVVVAVMSGAGAAAAEDSTMITRLVLLACSVTAVEWAGLRAALRWARPVVDWGLWLRALPLLACTIVLFPSAGLLTWPGVPWLALPLSAWLARRYGAAALVPVGIMLAPMLVTLQLPFAATNGSWGLWLAALLVARLVVDPLLLPAIAGMTRISRLATALLTGAGTLLIVTPEFSGAVVIASALSLVTVLVMLLGLCRVPFRPVAWALAIATMVGVGTGIFGITLSSGLGSLGFTSTSTSTMVGGGLVLAIARMRSSGTDQDGAGGWIWRIPPAFAGAAGFLPILFAIGWIDVEVVNIQLGMRGNLSLLALSHVLVIAFWIGVDGVAIRRWLMLLGALVGVVAVATGIGLNLTLGPLYVGVPEFRPVGLVAEAMTVSGFYAFGRVLSEWNLQHPASEAGRGESMLLGALTADLRRAVSIAIGFAALWIALILLSHAAPVPAPAAKDAAPAPGVQQSAPTGSEQKGPTAQ
ncbi:hypothetical protein FFK22_025085 [Mycobacterium sp. KBS0706]|uniref:hypothetical protein n=1 Tax=Mycobacterium sp. KBS0706 TaxID=2578109 RepID=UPI00110FB3D7|nr:hypothetical protein [Mycobacterium sp. KBS0706]TSD85875.1 hypothetical protein FFK22_025085 [Mycobacterium sp. KBS0706]